MWLSSSLNAGVTFTTWGQPTCPPQATLLYEGTVIQAGGLLQCLHELPETMQMNMPSHSTKQLQPLLYTSIHQLLLPIQCAVCYVPNRTSQFVSTGTKSCPISWGVEFTGALATSCQEPSNTVCVSSGFLEQEVNWEGLNHISLVEMECNFGSCPVSCSLCTR